MNKICGKFIRVHVMHSFILKSQAIICMKNVALAAYTSSTCHETVGLISFFLNIPHQLWMFLMWREMQYLSVYLCHLELWFYKLFLHFYLSLQFYRLSSQIRKVCVWIADTNHYHAYPWSISTKIWLGFPWTSLYLKISISMYKLNGFW